jgi:CRP-like cAMP-binding protein
MEPHHPLRRYPLFRVLDPIAIASWWAAGESRSVEVGETLFQAGTPGRHLYLVETGRVRVLRATREDQEVAVGTFGTGELFGEYALLEPGLNTATCRVANAGEMRQLPLEPLRQAVAAQPDVQLHLKRWLRLHAVLGHLRYKTFLGFMSAASLLPLLERFETGRFTAGRAIQADGLSDDCWFVILKGKVRLEHSPDVLLGPGNCFGEAALLGREGLPLAEAVIETECMVLRRDAFYRPLHDASSNSLQTRLSHLPAQRESYPWVGQQEASDCGVAALAMIARFHGQNIALETLRRRMCVEQRGTSLRELQQAAATLGLRSRAVRVGADQLGRVTLPAIAHLAGEHYVVVYSLGLSGVVIGDPAAGVLTLSLPAFLKTWTGLLLLLTRTDQGATAKA